MVQTAFVIGGTFDIYTKSLDVMIRRPRPNGAFTKGALLRQDSRTKREDGHDVGGAGDMGRD